jgi:hypothetical protein
MKGLIIILILNMFLVVSIEASDLTDDQISDAVNIQCQIAKDFQECYDNCLQYLNIKKQYDEKNEIFKGKLCEYIYPVYKGMSYNENENYIKYESQGCVGAYNNENGYKDCFEKISKEIIDFDYNTLASSIFNKYCNRYSIITESKEKIQKDRQSKREEGANNEDKTDLVLNRAVSSIGNAISDGILEKTELTKTLLMGFNTSDKDQSISFNANLYGLLCTKDYINDYQTYHDLTLNPKKNKNSEENQTINYRLLKKYLLQSNIAVSIPTTKNDGVELGKLNFKYKIRLYGDRDPRNANWDDKFLKLGVPEQPNFNYLKDKDQIIDEITKYLDAHKKWLTEKYDPLMKDIASSPLVTLSFSRFPLTALLENNSKDDESDKSKIDESKKPTQVVTPNAVVQKLENELTIIDPDEFIWMGVLSVDKMVGKLLNGDFNLTANAKFQLSDNSKADDDAIRENNKQFIFTAGFTTNWNNKCALSIDSEMDWDIDYDKEKSDDKYIYKISGTFIIPINETVKAKITYLKEQDKDGIASLGFDYDLYDLFKK